MIIYCNDNLNRILSSPSHEYHTFFNGERCNEYREELQGVGPLTPDNSVQTILSEDDHWHKIVVFVEKMLKGTKSDSQAMEVANQCTVLQ